MITAASERRNMVVKMREYLPGSPQPIYINPPDNSTLGGDLMQVSIAQLVPWIERRLRNCYSEVAVRLVLESSSSFTSVIGYVLDGGPIYELVVQHGTDQLEELRKRLAPLLEQAAPATQVAA